MTVIDSPTRPPMPLLRVAAVIALIVVGFFMPRLLGGGSVAYSTLTTIAIFAVMCYGVDLVLSYLGEVSLGHTLFWAVGGYTAANLSVKYGLNGWSTALATVGLCVVAAGFRLTRALAIDLMPQTFHVEVLAVFERSSPRA